MRVPEESMSAIPLVKSRWFQYGIACAVAALTLAARVALGDFFDGPTMILFTIPIVLSAYWGGLGPGFLATGITALGAAYYVLPPLGSFNVLSPTQRLQEFVLVVSGALISGICQRLHDARRRAQSTLAEFEAVQRELRDATKANGDLRLALDEHAIVAVTDQRGRITFVNDKFCAISQYSREDLLGADHRIINSGHHSAEFIRGIWTTIARGNVWHGEIKNRAKDGTFYWVDTTIVPFLNDAGKPEQYIAIRADITERKRAEELLRDNEVRFRTMANSIPQLAWMAHADGFIHWYNDRWYDYTGTTPKDMEGWGWQSVHDPAVLPEVMHGWGDAIKNGVPFEMEFPLRGADGKFRSFLTRVHPMKDAGGKVTQWFGTNTDVDELKRAEEAVRDLNASLEQRVIERTAEVEAANRELESFSYSVSHDLRAPLRAMNGFARMTIEEFGPSIPPEAARYLDRICKGGLRMGQLIDDLLAFSRLNRQPIKQSAINMTTVVQEVIGEIEKPIDGREVEFRVAELGMCRGDVVLLRQVWVNLISNALKYSRKSHQTLIEIGISITAGEHEYWVRDNGTGFDMQYAHKLFEVFQRLHPAEEFEGTGVGLAIVQRVVHRHGGRIWGEGEVGRGATFRFTLPMEQHHERN